MGHQAANCTQGTINWKGIYGEESFKLRNPVYYSQLDQVAKAKEVNADELTQRAVQYAKVRCCRLQLSLIW